MVQQVARDVSSWMQVLVMKQLRITLNTLLRLGYFQLTIFTIIYVHVFHYMSAHVERAEHGHVRTLEDKIFYFQTELKKRALRIFIWIN